MQLINVGRWLRSVRAETSTEEGSAELSRPVSLTSDIQDIDRPDGIEGLY
jgi:hypothetical protein